MVAVLQKSQGPGSISELGEYIRGMYLGCMRYGWHALGLAWALCILGWIMTFSLPDVYKSSTRLYVDTANTLRPLLKGLAVESDVMSEVRLMMSSIVSKPSLEKIAQQTGLDLQERATDQAGMDGLVNRMAASIEVTIDRGNVLEISYTHRDPQTTYRIVSALSDTYIEGSAGANRVESASAQLFLEGKIEEYEERLNAAETKLADFKRQNVGLMPGDGGDYYSRLEGEIQYLGSLESKIKIATSRRDEILRQLEGEEPVFGMVTTEDPLDVSVPNIDRQIEQFKDQLTELRLRFTDNHPDIVQINSIIADLEEEKAVLIAEKMPGVRRDYSAVEQNPVYQKMQIQLSGIEVELVELRAQRREQSRAVTDLREKVDTIPQVEAELTRLNRDYAVVNGQYEQFLQRLEAAKLSEDAGKSKYEIQFRTINPPTIPRSADGPNRGLIATVVLLFGIIGGVGLSVLLNISNPVFYTANDLERRFGIPVLGSIRNIRSPAEVSAEKIRWVWLSVCFTGLIIVFGLMVVLGRTHGQVFGANLPGIIPGL